jgi:hypothetical protein
MLPALLAAIAVLLLLVILLALACRRERAKRRALEADCILVDRAMAAKLRTAIGQHLAETGAGELLLDDREELRLRTAGRDVFCLPGQLRPVLGAVIAGLAEDGWGGRCALVRMPDIPALVAGMKARRPDLETGHAWPREFIAAINDKGLFGLMPDHIALIAHCGFLRGDGIAIHGLGDGVEQPRSSTDDAGEPGPWTIGECRIDGRMQPITCDGTAYRVADRSYPDLGRLLAACCG